MEKKIRYTNAIVLKFLINDTALESSNEKFGNDTNLLVT